MERSNVEMIGISLIDTLFEVLKRGFVIGAIAFGAKAVELPQLVILADIAAVALGYWTSHKLGDVFGPMLGVDKIERRDAAYNVRVFASIILSMAVGVAILVACLAVTSAKPPT